MATPPPPSFLEKTKASLQKKFDESAKVVNTLATDWDKWMNLYRHIIKQKHHSWESNLIVPKPYSLIETFTPHVLSTVFGPREFITVRNPALPEDELRQFNKWLVWFLLSKMKIYMRAMELFKGSPIYGTAYLKLYMRRGIPALGYVRPHDFYWDPRATEPGDVDSLAWCFHKIPKKDLGDLERAMVPRVEMKTGEMVIVTEPYPELVLDPLYFNLNRVWEKHIRDSGTEVEEAGATTNIPSLDLLEYWGEIETTFGTYDVNRKHYRPGRYEEYVVTAILKGDMIEDIIRCEPSTFYYEDPYEGRKYLKPFVASLYTLVPGQFTGQGAIQPVESLIEERKEHHDLYLDEHKRSVMTILKVREASQLTKKDLEFRPYNIWYMRNLGDVELVKSPEVNLQAFQYIDALLDREIDRTLAMSSISQAVPYTKRQTFGEIRALMGEQVKRFSVFLQMADHITLRPLVFKTLVLMRQMPQILAGQPFQMPEGDYVVPPDLLTERTHVSFAATGTEPEGSKYAKADIWPRVLKAIADVTMATGGKYELVLSEIIQEFENLYDIKDPQRFVRESRPSVPLDALMEATPPEYKEAMQAVIQQAMALLQAEKEMAREQR